MKNLKSKSRSLLTITFMFVAILLVNVLPVAAGGGDVVTYGEYECMEWTDGLDIIGYTGTSTTLTIPSMIEGKKVLGTWELELPEHVTKLVFESGIEQVSLVCDTTNVREVVFADDISNVFWYAIEESAFYKNQDNWKDGELYAGNCLLAVKEEKLVGTFEIKEGTIGVNQLLLQHTQEVELEKVVFPGSMKKLTNAGGLFNGNTTTVKELVFKEGVAEVDMYLEESEVPQLSGLWFPDSISNINLQIHADGVVADDGVAHFFETVKPIVYCSSNNEVAIEYAEKYGLKTQFITNEVESENNKNISIVNENKFKVGTKFLAEVLTSGEIYDNAKVSIASLVQNNEKYIVMEMNLVDPEGNEIHQLENNVTVTLDIPSELVEAKKIRVFRVVDGQYIECESKVEGEKISFITDHFSTYAFVEEKVECTEHVYGEWTVTKEATATEKGNQKRICSVCGKEENTEIPVLQAVENEQKDVIDKQKNTVEKAPKTGNLNGIMLWSILLIISFVSVMSIVNQKKIRK